MITESGERGAHVDAQPALRRGLRQRHAAIEFVEIGQQAHRALVIGGAVGRDGHPPRGPIAAAWSARCASSAWISLVTVAFGIPSRSAARVKVPASTTRTKARMAASLIHCVTPARLTASTCRRLFPIGNNEVSQVAIYSRRDRPMFRCIAAAGVATHDSPPRRRPSLMATTLDRQDDRDGQARAVHGRRGFIARRRPRARLRWCCICTAAPSSAAPSMTGRGGREPAGRCRRGRGLARLSAGAAASAFRNALEAAFQALAMGHAPRADWVEQEIAACSSPAKRRAAISPPRWR